MANNKTGQDYCNLIIDFINSKYTRLKPYNWYKEEDIVNYCIHETDELDVGDTEKIRKLVHEIVRELANRNYVNADGFFVDTLRRVGKDVELIVFEETRPMGTLSEIAIARLNATKEDNAPYVSMQELASFDWKKFGKLLKERQLLPPSYDKTPVRVDVKVSNAGEAMAEVVFKSTTSASYRTMKIYQNRIHEFVNGSNEARTSKEVCDAWNEFRERSLRNKEREQECEIARQLAYAKKLLAVEKVLDLEKAFIIKNRSSEFVDFDWHYSDIPTFTTEQGDILTPFTPKTLEFCVSRLKKWARKSQAEHLDEFKEKCEDIKEASVYRTEKWDATITLLTELIRLEAEEAKTAEEEEENE